MTFGFKDSNPRLVHFMMINLSKATQDIKSNICKGQITNNLQQSLNLSLSMHYFQAEAK